ncbi:MAG: hypothetical protein ACXVZL_12545, partial [Gaiellaceae bacterium]
MWTGSYWRKAPLALLFRPPLFAAVLAGSLLVALAAASSTLFSTAAGNAALRGKLTEITPFGAGLTVSSPLAAAPGATVRSYLAEASRESAALRRATASIPSLRAPVATLFGPPVVASATPAGATIQVRPVARSGFAAHVHRLSSAGGAGVWLASSAAAYLRVGAGDRIFVQQQQFLGFSRSVSVRVAAVYRPLWDEPVRSYWVNFSDVIYPPPAGQDGPTPPTFLLGSPEELVALARRVNGYFDHIVEFPVETHGITLRQAERIERRFSALRAELRAGRTPLAQSAGCRAPGLCGVRSSLTAAIELARRDVDAVSAPTRLLSDIGVLIALGVFAAAGAYLVVRRRAEARLLYARGVPAPAFAAHTALEALLPTALGAAAGFGLALGLVRLSEPTGALDGTALRSAAARAALGVVVGLALLAAAATLSFLRQYEATAWAGRRLGALPWELALVGIAVWLLVDVTHGGGVDAHGVPSLEVFL